VGSDSPPASTHSRAGGLWDVIGFTVAFFAFSFLILCFIGWKGQDFALTNRRAITKGGVLGRRVMEVPLRTVESTSTKRA